VDVLRLLTIIALGAVELWAAIPAGLALKANPVVVGVAAAVGAMLGVLVVVGLGEHVRHWLPGRHRGDRATGSHGLIRAIWDRYGVIGLGLFAPMLTGAPIGAALGLTLGVPAGDSLLGQRAVASFWFRKCKWLMKKGKRPRILSPHARGEEQPPALIPSHGEPVVHHPSDRQAEILPETSFPPHDHSPRRPHDRRL